MYIWVYLAVFSSFLSAAPVDVPLRSVGHSYSSNIQFGSVEYDVILDTASNKLLYSDNITDEVQLDANCLSLSIDDTYANFTSYNTTCTSNRDTLSISNTSSAQVTAKYFVYRSITNTALHNWNDTSGVFGIGYPTCDTTSACKKTPFQAYLNSYTASGYNPNIFGLDFNQGDSSMQLGNVSQVYAKDLIWSSPQALEFPTSHKAFLYNLQFCDIQLQSNWSHVYDVIVDTASACVSLPKEFYDSFDAWINTTIELPLSIDNQHMSDYDILMSHDVLPLLSFSLQEYGALSHISLADLIVNASDIVGEPGAPYIHLFRNGAYSSSYRLCILRGMSLIHVSDMDANHVYNNPPIVLGSLALRSLYFAANFATRKIAFANKRFYSNLTRQCMPLIQCQGEQLTDRSLNRCKEPWCAKQFFKIYDSSSGTCSYDTAAVVVGLIFIVMIVIIEMSTFFVGEYSSQHLSTPANGNPVPDHKLDIVTKTLATFVTGIIDVVVIYVCQWAPIPQHHNLRAVTPQHSESSPDSPREDRWVAVNASRENDIRMLSLSDEN